MLQAGIFEKGFFSRLISGLDVVHAVVQKLHLCNLGSVSKSRLLCVCVKFVVQSVLPADAPNQHYSIQRLGYPDCQIESQYRCNEIVTWDP